MISEGPLQIVAGFMENELVQKTRARKKTAWGSSEQEPMSEKEATARIKINNLLEESGWRFFGADGV